MSIVRFFAIIDYFLFFHISYVQQRKKWHCDYIYNFTTVIKFVNLIDVCFWTWLNPLSERAYTTSFANFILVAKQLHAGNSYKLFFSKSRILLIRHLFFLLLSFPITPLLSAPLPQYMLHQIHYHLLIQCFSLTNRFCIIILVWLNMIDLWQFSLQSDGWPTMYLFGWSNCLSTTNLQFHFGFIKKSQHILFSISVFLFTAFVAVGNTFAHCVCNHPLLIVKYI